MTNLPGLRCVRAPNPSLMTLDGTRTYIIGERHTVVVDPGPALSGHLSALAGMVASADSVTIVLTHAHADHAGGAARLAERLRARIHMADPERLGGGPRPWIERCSEGDRFPTDAGELVVLSTPGHAPDHIALHWKVGETRAGDAIFVGDLLLGAGETALVAAPEGSVRQYLESLDRIERIGAGLLLPAHGEPLRNPGEALERHRRHRLARVDQVRMHLAEAPGLSADLLVERIYGPDLDPALRQAAKGSLRAILEFLDAAGGE